MMRERKRKRRGEDEELGKEGRRETKLANEGEEEDVEGRRGGSKKIGIERVSKG